MVEEQPPSARRPGCKVCRASAVRTSLGRGACGVQKQHHAQPFRLSHLCECPCEKMLVEKMLVEVVDVVELWFLCAVLDLDLDLESDLDFFYRGLETLTRLLESILLIFLFGYCSNSNPSRKKNCLEDGVSAAFTQALRIKASFADTAPVAMTSTPRAQVGGCGDQIASVQECAELGPQGLWVDAWASSSRISFSSRSSSEVETLRSEPPSAFPKGNSLGNATRKRCQRILHKAAVKLAVAAVILCERFLEKRRPESRIIRRPCKQELALL